jgi:hypothetical protein
MEMTLKVAVLFTGFLRQKEVTKSDYEQKLLERFDADVFVATWDLKDIARPDLNSDVEQKAESEVTGSEVAGFFTPRLRDYLILSYDLFRETTPAIKEIDRPNDLLKLNGRAAAHGAVWMNRLYSQWYMVRRGLQMIREFEERTGVKYDVIARARTDMRFLSEFPEPDMDSLMFPSTYPGGTPVPLGAVADHFYWGGHDVMLKLETLCFEIATMYERQNIDATYAEAVFYAFAVKHDIYLQPFDAQYERV